MSAEKHIFESNLEETTKELKNKKTTQQQKCSLLITESSSSSLCYIYFKCSEILPFVAICLPIKILCTSYSHEKNYAKNIRKIKRILIAFRCYKITATTKKMKWKNLLQSENFKFLWTSWTVVTIINLFFFSKNILSCFFFKTHNNNKIKNILKIFKEGISLINNCQIFVTHEQKLFGTCTSY